MLFAGGTLSVAFQWVFREAHLSQIASVATGVAQMMQVIPRHSHNAKYVGTIKRHSRQQHASALQLISLHSLPTDRALAHERTLFFFCFFKYDLVDAAATYTETKSKFLAFSYTFVLFTKQYDATRYITVFGISRFALLLIVRLK